MGKTKGKLITEKQIYLQELENVKANRFLTNQEKKLKINELLSIIKRKKDGTEERNKNFEKSSV